MHAQELAEMVAPHGDDYKAVRDWIEATGCTIDRAPVSRDWLGAQCTIAVRMPASAVVVAAAGGARVRGAHGKGHNANRTRKRCWRPSFTSLSTRRARGSCARSRPTRCRAS